MPDLKFRDLICADALHALEVLEIESTKSTRQFPWARFSELFPADDRYSEGEFCGLVDMSLSLCVDDIERRKLIEKFIIHLNAMPTNSFLERIGTCKYYCQNVRDKLVRDEIN